MKRFPSTATNAFATNAVLDTGKGKLLWVASYNKNASARWLMVFDAAELPANGTVALGQVQVLNGQNGVLDCGSGGMPFANGLVAALSSTEASLTIALAADGLFTAVTDYE